MTDAFLILVRLGLAGLVGFEGLNWFGVLKVQLEFSWLGLVVTAVAVIILLEGATLFLKRATGRGLHPAAYLVGAASLCIDAFGDILHLYGRFGWYDQVAHFVGGATVAIVACNVFWRLEGAGRMRLGARWRSMFVVSIGAFFGSLYEIEEYLEDLWKWHRQVRLGDGPDTANDLLLNIVGAIAVVVAVALWQRLRLRSSTQNYAPD